MSAPASAMSNAASAKSAAASAGPFLLRPLRLDCDAATIVDWVRRPYAEFWGMRQKTPAEIAAFYADLLASPHEAAFVGLDGGRPAFLVETYDPAHHEIAGHYAVQAGDRGMHVFVGPAETPVAGFTGAVFRAVMHFLFADPAIQRVVVEPDVRNEKIQALNLRYGFIRERDIVLRDKTAALSFCTRARFVAAIGIGDAA